MITARTFTMHCFKIEPLNLWPCHVLLPICRSHMSLAAPFCLCLPHTRWEASSVLWRIMGKNSQASVLLRTQFWLHLKHPDIFVALHFTCLHWASGHNDFPVLNLALVQYVAWNVEPMFNPASKGGHSCGVLTVIVPRWSFSPAWGPEHFGIRFSYSAASQTPVGPSGVFPVQLGQ